MKFVLKWTNRYSNETGYVAKIAKSKGWFENTADIAGARRFRFVKETENAIAQLAELGETENNDFTAVEVED